MAGIQFHGTQDLDQVVDFYQNLVGMEIWLRQEDCIILKHGNFLLGFCRRERSDTSGIITFFYREATEIDVMHKKLEVYATTAPAKNERYEIYRFLARDPENRTVEFQAFLHPVDSYVDGQALLTSRRSIRSFKETPVSDEVLWEVFEICRYSPTSRNSQSYYFMVVREPNKLAWLASLRGSSSAPIARAKLAVVVSADPDRSARHVQDGCIAGYHFTLAAWLHGLGTCWIAAMDRDDVKEGLGIPRSHYIATITPVGYPSESPQAPLRRRSDEMVKFY